MKAIVALTCFLALVNISPVDGQSLEIMPGTERVFVDVQWLKFFDDGRKWSLFSRTRATSDYEQNTDLFTGAYVNYTTELGFGATTVGRIGRSGATGDIGLHFFKASKNLLIYALTSVELNNDLWYSWFSILRYTPSLSKNWDLYSSLELFSGFKKEGHSASVQRLRLGLDNKGYQFGLGLNLAGFGRNYDTTDSNPGLFVRKKF